MAKPDTKKYGNRPEGLEPSAIHAGLLQRGSAYRIQRPKRSFKYNFAWERSQGGFL